MIKKYTIVAGVNGAGKSTLYQLNPRLRNEHRVNADEILRELQLDWRDFSSVLVAGKEAVKRLNTYINEGISFNQETTLCNLVAIYDNTLEFRRFAIYKDGCLVRRSHNVPEWFSRKFE